MKQPTIALFLLLQLCACTDQSTKARLFREFAKTTDDFNDYKRPSTAEQVSVVDSLHLGNDIWCFHLSWRSANDRLIALDNTFVMDKRSGKVAVMVAPVGDEFAFLDGKIRREADSLSRLEYPPKRWGYLMGLPEESRVMSALLLPPLPLPDTSWAALMRYHYGKDYTLIFTKEAFQEKIVSRMAHDLEEAGRAGQVPRYLQQADSMANVVFSEQNLTGFVPYTEPDHRYIEFIVIRRDGNGNPQAEITSMYLLSDKMK
jgi:hypothetical protein